MLELTGAGGCANADPAIRMPTARAAGRPQPQPGCRPMFTLQILDRGQTFLHPLDDRPLLLGSGDDAGIRLGEEGVAVQHARIERGPDGWQLVALAATRVNGAAVTRAMLTLGDRIELGRSVIVVGRTVARAAQPEDVLANPVRRTRSRPVAPRRNLALPIAAALLLAGGIVWVALQAGDSGVREELAAIANLRQKGQLEQAVARIEQLRGEWAAAADDRLQQLDGQLTEVRSVEAAVARLTAAVLEPSDVRGYADWSRELQQLESKGQPPERVAARLVRGSLRETIERRPRLVREPAPAEVPATATAATQPSSSLQPATAGSPAPNSLLGKVDAPAVAQDPDAAVRPTASVDLAEVDRLCAEGLFAPAIALLQATLADAAGDAGVAQLRARIDAVRSQASAAGKQLATQAREHLAAGRAEQALALLQAASNRIPAGAGTADLDAVRSEAENHLAAARRKVVPAAPTAVAPEVRMATLAALRAQMDTIRAAEEQGAFAVAAEQLRAASTAVAERDPDFAQRLSARADEAELLAAWHDEVAAALAAGKSVVTTGKEGESVTLRGNDGPVLVGSNVAGEVRLLWSEVPARGLQAIAEQLRSTGRPALGAAAMLYKQGETAAAEALLGKVVQADAGHKAAVDRVIARGRGEPLDPRGYVFGKDGFVSARSVEVQKDAQKLANRLEAAMRDKDPQVREQLVAEVLGAGPDSVAVLAAAMRREFDRQLGKLDAGALKKQVDRLAAQREQLDQARQHARQLIYDEVKYFYPYKPPAVSSDRYAEYVRVQAEVDRRVAAVRTLWSDERTKVRVPASLRADLDRLDWAAKVLAELGELDPQSLQRVEWARALPPGDAVGVRDYCRTSAERAELEEWRHIDAYNAAIGKQLSSAQREQLRITNEYRALFRHRPLAAVKSLCAASQAHAEEMSKLGYFSHMSPTEGRRTPSDRMRLHGYNAGVSENIALVDGAQGAHNAWCTSSGHHRNLLDPHHTEMGIGADGRYWVQNFGSGTAHRDEPDWSGTAGR